jgi:outer membrane receptor protein involved in Fe transport
VGHRGRALSRAALVLLALALPGRADELTETIVVSAARESQPGTEASGVVTAVPAAELARAKALDEALRRDPSFAVFRRSSSLVADPSSQGVNLRGIGPSGVSRALVLEDGVPLNDAFGGWMYWGAVPRLGVARVEIAPGASSALYGSSALGGVVQVVTRPIEDRLELEIEGGRFGTAAGGLSAAGRAGRFGGSLDLEGLRTDGYGIVAEPGAVDGPASSRRAAARARAEALVGEDAVLSARFGGFAEDQNGGTQYTTASARDALVSLGLEVSGVEAVAFARWARFGQDRARLAPDRSAETLASTQSAPADDEGVSVTWRRGGFLLGMDARRVFGRSLEDLYGGPVATRDASGEQRSFGAFAQQLFDPLSWLQVQAAARLDLWRNLGGVRHEVLAGGGTQDTDLADRSDVALSPRLALRARAMPWLSLRAAAYRSFRAPTLNELYRPFQVGQVRTEANPDLGPETLLGAEAGFDTPWLRMTAFYADLRDPIVNASTSVANLQMRQNLGSARIAGLEVEAAWRPIAPLRLSAAWTFADARVTSGDLDGRFLPQDPRHRLVAAISYADARIAEVEAALRWTSEQFEDDRNQLRLPGYAVLDVQVTRSLASGWDLFVAAENLLDRQYLVGLQGGVATLGQPLFLRAGLRIHLH